MLRLDVECLRNNHRVSQNAIADYLGIYASQLSAMLHGRMPVSDPVEHGVDALLDNPFAIASLTMPLGLYEDDYARNEIVNVKRLNAFMRNYNFNQSQIAERCDFTPAVVNGWVHGTRTINQEATRWIVNFKGDPWDVKLDPGHDCPSLKFIRTYDISQERFANMDNEADLWGLRDFDQEALLALVRHERHSEAIDAILLATAALRYWRQHPSREYHQQYLAARAAAEEAVAFGRHFDAVAPISSSVRLKRRGIDTAVAKLVDLLGIMPEVQAPLDLLRALRLTL
jgi:transcriptional regulator with XRE-family HTH domain